MRSWARELAFGLLLAAAIPTAAGGAAPSAVQVLLDKANYWRLKDRPDLAAAALQQLLSADPNQPDGLYQYGIIEVQQGNIEQAKAYLARLRQAAPSNPQIADLENAIRAGQISPSELSEARRLAQRGQFAQAAKQYEQIFKGTPPPGFGIEYYTTLAGTPQGWEEARRGLENLAQKSPNDSRTRLALAEVLTYRADTRAQGIGMLEQLAGDPVVGDRALRAWRRALMWLGVAPQDRQFYARYLARFPQDADIRQHIVQAEKESAAGAGAAGAIGYNDLNRGRLTAAEREFAARLRLAPVDPNALAGLGLVRLRQQRFGEARDLLGRAMRAAPAQRAQWAAAYESAAFWSEVNAAKAAIAANNYRRAQAILSGLVGRPRNINWNAYLLLGDINARLGNHAAAENAYRQVLAVQPDDPTALVGLYTALTAEGKTAEAANLSARVAALAPAQLAGANRARAEMLRTEGEGLEARGDMAGAGSRYAEAIAVDSSAAWARLDYARFLARRGDAVRAAQIIDPTASGSTAESIQAAAIFYSEQNNLPEALALLDRIPLAARTPDIAALRDRIRVTAEVDRAKRLAAGGNPAAARDVLMSLYSNAPPTPQKTRLIADALADIGDTQDALQLGRPDPATVANDPTAMLGYAALLFKAGEDTEAIAYVAQAEKSGHYGPADRQKLEHLKIDIAAKRADQLRTNGDIAGAYDQISPLLAAYPNDPTLLTAAGRLYAAAGQNAAAMRFFDAAYRQAPADINVIRSVVGGAIVAGDLARAQAYLDAGMRLYPDNPRLYYLAAEIARANGDNGAAVSDLATARRLDTEQAGTLAPMSSTAPPSVPGSPERLPPNPFRQSQTGPPRPRVMLAAALQPVTATDSSPLLPAAPAALDDTAVSADSADLLIPPRASERPARPTPVAATAAAASEPPPDPEPDPPSQLAPQPSAGASDVELGPREWPGPPPAPSPATELAQLEPLPPPIAGYQRQPDQPPAAATPLQPLQPAPIAGYPPPASGEPVPAPSNSLELDIERSMAAIAAQSGPVLQEGLAFRAREGEAGLTQLTEIGVPIEGTFSPFYTGTVRLQAIPTFLSAGTPSASALLRFGSDPLLAKGPTDTTTVLPSPGSQSARGVSLDAAYAYQIFSGEIGTTPLGFPVENLTGRLALMWPGPAANAMAFPTIPLAPPNASRPLQVMVEGVRQSVTDSLLSYAGTRDPLTGAVWGGVVKTAGNALLSYDDGQVGFYGGGGYAIVDGQSVASNSEADAIVGGYLRPWRSTSGTLKVGVNLYYMGYDKNLRFFTFGQGGYFSPQNYVSITMPVEYSGRSGRLSYLAGGALGVQNFDESRSPYFPTDPSRQAALEGTFGSAAFYPSRSVTGLAFNAKGQIEYQLDYGFAVGGLASVDNAQSYTEGLAKIYLRKSFGALPSAAILPNPIGGSL